MSSDAERIKLMEAEVARLDHELGVLERQWGKKHLLAFFGVLAIPCYFLFGPLVAGVVVVCTPALVATQAYLLYVRRAECRQLIQETRRELAYLRGQAPVAKARTGSPFEEDVPAA